MLKMFRPISKPLIDVAVRPEGSETTTLTGLPSVGLLPVFVTVNLYAADLGTPPEPKVPPRKPPSRLRPSSTISVEKTVGSADELIVNPGAIGDANPAWGARQPATRKKTLASSNRRNIIPSPSQKNA
jgi:hypothetical protein